MLHLLRIEAVERRNHLPPKVTVAKLFRDGRGHLRRAYSRRFRTVALAKSSRAEIEYYFLIEEGQMYEVYAEYDKLRPKRLEWFVGYHDGREFCTLTRSQIIDKGFADVFA